METIPILFDTDMGSDIDDALALAYLLKQPRCELLGITTVTGDTQKRAALADILCRAAGRESVPIHAGLTGPLLTGPGQPNVPQYGAVAHMPHRGAYPTDAVTFLAQSIRARPHEITLLAVGPFTNVAALFACDPEVAGLLKEIVLMGGVFNNPDPNAREWNALIDPIATAILFRHAPPGKLLSVGLDVTTKCSLPADACRRRFKAAGGTLGIVGDMAEVWFQHTDRITFHDPLAATLIFAPDLCVYDKGTVSPVIEPGKQEGATRWQVSADGPHRIAAMVKPEPFFADYFAVTDKGG